MPDAIGDQVELYSRVYQVVNPSPALGPNVYRLAAPAEINQESGGVESLEVFGQVPIESNLGVDGNYTVTIERINDLPDEDEL